MAGNDAKIIVTRNFHYAKLSNICLWIICSWEAIDDKIVIRSFKTCEISTHLDSDLKITDKEDNVSDKDINSNDN